MQIRQDFITINPYSRPGTKREQTLGAVVHWTENPGTDAQFTRDFFEDLKYGLTSYHDPKKKWYGSAHYAIDENETVQIMPEDEVAWSVGALRYTEKAKEAFGKYCADPYNTSPNYCTVSVELCHADWSGKFSDKVLEQAVELCADICYRNNIPTAYLFRHYDITGKKCPKWFVEHEDEFDEFRLEVTRTIRAMLEYFERGKLV